MIVLGCRAARELFRSARLPSVCRRAMAVRRSPEMNVPAAAAAGRDDGGLASPSSENLLLFSESPTHGWAAPARRLATDARRGAGDEPAGAPSIVLTPAEAEPEPPAEAEAEAEPANAERAEPAAPPPSTMAAYLRTALRDLVQARNESKAPHTLELLTRHVVVAYGELAPADQQQFFRTLAEEHGVDHQRVVAAASELSRTQEDAQLLKKEEGLASLLQPDYVWIFKQLGRTEGGVKFLVDMRANLLKVLAATDAMDPSLAGLRALGAALKELIALWFSVGFLQLERITWQSPCSMLEKVSEYEAVHPVRNWTDLKRRVGPYRRCFVFTHNAMPCEPVVVLHTALTPSISSSIQDIVRKPRRFSLSEYLQGGAEDMINDEDPTQITSAIFYSISSTQKGLQGIELGNYLIKRVVRELLAEYPHLSQFSSLSPIPGFKNWLITEINKAERGQCELLTPDEWSRLAELTETEGGADTLRQLKRLVASCGWLEEDGELCELLRAPLMRLCARYLYREKRRGSALDSVANFHLRNGAVMWRLNWRADLTARGLSNSCGVMVNYRYFLDQTQQNSEQYLSTQTIAASESVREMAAEAAGLAPPRSAL